MVLHQKCKSDWVKIYTTVGGAALACAVWLDAARAVTTTGNVRVTLGSAVGNPVLGSHAKDSCSI